MGKFFITVSGTDYKGEVISEVFYLGNASEETKSACIDLFNERWANTHYAPYDIKVDVLDVDEVTRNFKVTKDEDRRRKFQEIWKNMTQEEREKWVAECKF